MRSDAGREILSILSASREERARSWLVESSPPARASNPLINDLSFRHQHAPEEAVTYGLTPCHQVYQGWNL